MRRQALWLLCITVGLVFASACDRRQATSSTTNEFVHFEQQLRLDAETWHYADGEWFDDFGDAAFFGAAFYVRAGYSEGNPAFIERARQIRATNRAVITRALADGSWMLAHFEEVQMAALGLIEYGGATQSTTDAALLDQLITLVDAIVRGLNNYVSLAFGEFAANTYGPTSMSAGWALLLLQYAKYLNTDKRADYIARAETVVAAIADKVWTGSNYRFAPDVERMYLYPNAIMIGVLARLYEVTGKRAYLEQAEATVEGIAALRDASQGNYHSPYSQTYQGATTDDYSTLSSQNYLSLALLILYQNSPKPIYLQRVRELLRFSQRLYDAKEHKLLHHWIDGRVALPTDPDYFCSGCNLQYLYILWYLRQVEASTVAQRS